MLPPLPMTKYPSRKYVILEFLPENEPPQVLVGCLIIELLRSKHEDPKWIHGSVWLW